MQADRDVVETLPYLYNGWLLLIDIRLIRGINIQHVSLGWCQFTSNS